MAAPAPSPFQQGPTPPGQLSPIPAPELQAVPIPEKKSIVGSISSSVSSALQPLTSPISNTWASFQKSREALGLPNPGQPERLTSEVKSTHLTQWFFEGARADISKTLSANPVAQVSHSFAYGAPGTPPTYNFGAVYGHEKLFLQAGIDGQGALSGRCNRLWAPGHTTKLQGSLVPGGEQSFLQIEQEAIGIDNVLSLKAGNPSPAFGTGVFTLNYLQSFSRNLALGVELTTLRRGEGPSPMLPTYQAKWTSDARDAIATLQLSSPGQAQATYWQRLAEKVDAGVDFQCVTAEGRREAMATIGAKWDFRMSTFRAQVDSTGKVGSLLETRLGVPVAFTIGGEIDHFKGAAKFGVGVSIESASENIDPTQPPTPPPSLPM